MLCESFVTTALSILRFWINLQIWRIAVNTTNKHLQKAAKWWFSNLGMDTIKNLHVIKC